MTPAKAAARRWRAGLIGLCCALLAAALPGGSGAEPSEPSLSLRAKDGVCSGFYAAGGDYAYGFAWLRTGELIWYVLDRRRDKRDAVPMRLEVRTSSGEVFSGVTEVDQDADGLRTHTLEATDRRNARLILSGDIMFEFEPGGRKVTGGIAAGVHAPRIANCLNQARSQTLPASSEDSASPDSASPEGGGPRVIATGSGVFVDGRGTVVTNAHVIEGCRAVVSPTSGTAEVLAVDAASDLALLRFPRTGAAFARLRESGIRLGEPVVVAGYPLQSVLANGLNITTGNVSALAGPGGDRRFVQISAPVQPGNSGGALLDANGHLIGVIVARLNYKDGQPQNVNFAVAPYVVGAFLRENGVAIGPLGPAAARDVASAARQFTTFLQCVG